MKGLSEIQKRIEKKYPFKGEFDPEKLAADLRNRGDVMTVIYEGRRYGWIGNRGTLLAAPVGMRKSYIRCAEVHGEEAAKTWAWLQGWIVSTSIIYSDIFKEELEDGNRTDGPAGDGVEAEASPTVQPARDWKRESSGEGLDDTSDGLFI